MSRENGISGARFRGATGGAEHFIVVEAPAEPDLGGQIAILEKRYAEARAFLGLGPETAVFRRLFLSDAMNQAAELCASDLVAERAGDPVAVSIVQQPPLSGAKIALLAYHVEGPLTKRRLSPHHVVIETAGSRHLWSTRLCAGAADRPGSARRQTEALFDDLIATLSAAGGTLRDHGVRTWIYVKDIDAFYHEMVAARRALFTRQGMTAETHYLASTCIEGACAHRFDLVAMDAYSVLGLTPEQVSYLNDFDRLCPTHDYGVTFERGTRIAYADRAHHFVSGTASIDRTGHVVHRGDVLAQLERALGNVDALLRSGSARLADLTHLVVYLRDPTDFHRIDEALRSRFPALPVLIVQAAVCRPEWIVEVEGIAIAANDAPALPAF